MRSFILSTLDLIAVVGLCRTPKGLLRGGNVFDSVVGALFPSSFTCFCLASAFEMRDAWNVLRQHVYGVDRVTNVRCSGLNEENNADIVAVVQEGSHSAELRPILGRANHVSHININ